MSEPDELLERLGGLEREYDDAFPHAWEDVVRGDRTAADVLAERQGIDDPQELRALAEGLRPLRAEEREAWVDRLAAGLGAPTAGLGAARSTEPTAPAPVASLDPRPRPRARLAWLITAGASLAAAALVLWLLRPRDDFARVPEAAVLTVAGPGWSWNLSRDMLADVTSSTLVDNPLGAWTFLDSSISGPLSTPMPNGVCWGGVPLTCWEDAPTGYRDSAMVGIPTVTVTNLACPYVIPLRRGIPILQPGPHSNAIVRWTNPLDHPITIQILGRFTAIDPCGPGDGVVWSVFDPRGNTLNSGVLVSTMRVQRDIDVFYIPRLTVDASGTIDFVVHPRANYLYDGTELEVVIVGQP
jgi:hypothetical protein